jgi:hypothetical protein
MEFHYAEVKSQEHLNELKMMGFVCINHILVEVPDNVIVLAKLTMREDDPNYAEMLKHSASMDISTLSYSSTISIVAILHKRKEHKEQQEILKEIAKIYPEDIDLKREINKNAPTN